MREQATGGSDHRAPARSGRPASQSRRASTISSWVRPTKFHHISRSSVIGSPPRTSTRAPGSGASCTCVAPPPQILQSTSRHRLPVNGQVRIHGEHCVLEIRLERQCRETGEIHLRAHERRKRLRRIKTPRTHPPSRSPVRHRSSTTGRSAWWAKSAFRKRSRGSATHNCTPCSGPDRRSTRVRDATTRRHDVQLPGRTCCREPRLSRCSTSPASSHETVCRPMWGAAGPTYPHRRVRRVHEAPGPDRPDPLGATCGAPSWPGPTEGTSRGSRCCTGGETSPRWPSQDSSAGRRSRLLMELIAGTDRRP